MSYMYISTKSVGVVLLTRSDGNSIDFQEVNENFFSLSPSQKRKDEKTFTEIK